MIAAKRQSYVTRRIRLVGEVQRQTALAAIANLPADSAAPLELLIREEVKARKPTQNERMWAGPLRDIAEQGYINGRTFSAEVWHEHFKAEYLPDPDAPDFDPTHVRDGYRKWDFNPKGDRVLVGSTTQLTVRGFALYMTQVEAFARIELGVQLSTSPTSIGREG